MIGARAEAARNVPAVQPSFFRNPVGVALLIVTAGVLLWGLFVVLRPLPGRDLTIATGPRAAPTCRWPSVIAKYGARRCSAASRADGRRGRERGATARWKGGSARDSCKPGTTEPESPDLVSLGTVFYEPVWVFCRCESLAQLLQLLAARCARVDRTGRAARGVPWRSELLALVGIDTKKLQLLDYPPEEAARRLIAAKSRSR